MYVRLLEIVMSQQKDISMLQDSAYYSVSYLIVLVINCFGILACESRYTILFLNHINV
jgi:hypothetical protein